MTRWYLFADESGNFDYTRKEGATRYFAVGTIMFPGDAVRLKIRGALNDLSDELLHEDGPCPDAFHATLDKQVVRDRVFAALRDLEFFADVTALDKRKAKPHIRESEVSLYRYAWWMHFKRPAWSLSPGDELIVIAATLGTRKSRAHFVSALEDVIRQQCHSSIKRRVLFWKDDADRCIQAADYCLWAVMKDLEKNDKRALAQISPRIRSVFAPFQNGSVEYY